MNNREQIQRTLARRLELGEKNLEDVLVQMLDAASLTSNPAGKVAGYTAQPDAKVALVNEFKQDEERLLRKLDAITRVPGAPMDQDQRWIAIARTHFQEGFMALNRAVFQPQRIKLPEDDAKPPVELDPVLNAERN